MTTRPSAVEPLVSVLTPVYNNADDLVECIESVLAQTYSNWEYTIVNNCSTDASGEIARSYAARDPRITVVDNPSCLPVYGNLNASLRFVSPAAKYCKYVFGDDWIYPECIEAMVAVAEAHPNVSFVSAYGIEGAEVKWVGMPHPQMEIDGREVGRRYFLEGLNVFGTPHSVLYRADLVRARQPFFDESNWTADRETCLALLREHNLGFAYKILTYSRLRPGSTNPLAAQRNSYIAGTLYDLHLHGRHFLDAREYALCRRNLEREYFNFLALNLWTRRQQPDFWAYHRLWLTKAGARFSWATIAKSAVIRVFRAIVNPHETFDKRRRAAALLR